MLIVLEGIDGCGKTTVARKLAGRMRDLGFDVVESKDPGGTPLGEAVRAIVMDKEIGSKAMAPGVVDLMFLASHVQNWRMVVEPALKAGKVVVSDRWWYSQDAYSLIREVPVPIKAAYDDCHGKDADLLILLHGDVKRLVDRARQRLLETHQANKAWNDYDVLAKVQQKYFTQNQQRDEFREVCVDGKDQEQVFNEVCSIAGHGINQYQMRYGG